MSIPGRVNQEYSVTVTLDPGLLNDVSVTVSLGRDGGFTAKDSVTLNSGNPTGTLNYTARAYDASYGVPLTVNVSSSTPDVPDYAYGELAGAVHFSNAQGFVFESDGQHSDSHTLRLTKPWMCPTCPQVEADGLDGAGKYVRLGRIQEAQMSTLSS